MVFEVLNVSNTLNRATVDSRKKLSKNVGHIARFLKKLPFR